jgi:RNA polymerase sigma-70 factor (ECF subfamily)
LEEKTLIIGLRNRDKDSFEYLVDFHKDRIFNLIIGITQNVEDAEDLSQDVFVEVFNSICDFREDSSLHTWLYRIAVNKSLELIRKRNRKKRFGLVISIFGGNEELQIPDFEHPGVILENKERAAVMFKAIEKLPVNQRTAFILSKMEELSYKEISEIMKISIPSVDSLLFRSKANLKKFLENYYHDKINLV